MAVSITRPTHLLTTRIWPTWLPGAMVEAERRASISTVHPKRQFPTFQFSACLQSLFSLQDSILGVQNPFNLQQARAFSQSQSSPASMSMSMRRGMDVGRARMRALTTTEGRIQTRGEHSSTRQARSKTASSSVQTRERERRDRYRVMESRILSVL